VRRLLLVVLFLAGCGGSDPAPPTRPAATATPAPEQPAPTVRHAHCARAAGNCAVATGRVLYVEEVDPDGDGDAHYVLAGGKVTAPGISVIDVEAGMRPRRLPKAGELVSAAGPVYTGSYGQRQIEATELHHQRPR
jgi:hypothetical protein